LTEARPLPDDFRFGVATAGFQVEGGYNGPGEPRNNWHRWEHEGRVEPSGIALDFWNSYEHHFDRAAATGCDSFRLSIEWARCEPREGEIDETAFDRYAAILDAAQERGLEPLVTLHHFTHPEWLGENFWLQLDAPDRFAAWARAAMARLGARCRNWVTLNEINILALQTYLAGQFPPGRLLSVGDVVRSLDHLLAAHVLGYAEIHAARPDAVVATNTFTFSLYELDRLLTDLLFARTHGVDLSDLRPWLVERRAAFEARVRPFAGAERALRVWAKTAIPLEQAFPRTVTAVYASPYECTQDVAQIDHYDPVVHHHFRVPGHTTAGGRCWLPGRMLWDDPPAPPGLRLFSELHAEPGVPVWIVENGLCNRVRNGRSYPRSDGWDRPQYLRAHLAQVAAMVDAGIDVGGYWHWSLVDNYEWGSYEPRFGLYGVDRDRGGRWLDTDAMGHDSAGAYRQLIDALRSGDRAALTVQ
jgi:beta-glucosidase